MSHPHELFKSIKKQNEFTVIVYLFVTILLCGVAYIQHWIVSAFFAGFMLGRTISAISQLKKSNMVLQMINSGQAEIVVKERK